MHLPRASWPLPAASQVPFPAATLAQLTLAMLASWLFPSHLINSLLLGPLPECSSPPVACPPHCLQSLRR